jgi:hypothetical protein
MLAAIQHGFVEETIDCMPTHIIYQALNLAHVARSAGYSSWDTHGPKYILGEDGKAKYQGHFDDDKSRLIHKLKRILDKSYTYKKIFHNKKSVNKQDVELFIQIVNSAKEISKHLFKESSFQVILWDSPHLSSDTDIQHYNMMEKGLNKNHRVHLVSDILPGYPENKAKYEISSPHEWHPNYLAYDRISSYIVDAIINYH